MKETIDTRIRNIDLDTWELFKKHCEDESKKRRKYISVNKRLKEMISIVVASSSM